jgi:hypothetical protein
MLVHEDGCLYAPAVENTKANPDTSDCYDFAEIY